MGKLVLGFYKYRLNKTLKNCLLIGAILPVVLAAPAVLFVQDASAIVAGTLCSNGDRLKPEEGDNCPDGSTPVTDQEIIDACGRLATPERIRNCIASGGTNAEGPVIGGNNEENQEGEEEDRSCEGNVAYLGWVVCPIIWAATGTLNLLDDLINTLLTIQPEFYEDEGVRGAWASIRNIAYILLVPTTLIMVISTAVGLDFLSAYTIKRALPRLFLAVVFMALSFELLIFFIEFTNAVGQGILGIISNAFGEDSQALQLDEMVNIGLSTFFLNWALLVGAAAAFIFLLPYLPTLLLMAMTGLLILLLRQVLIVALLIVAPLAIVAWIFAERTRLWNLWWDSFSKLLLMYPLIMIIIGIGRAFAYIILCPGGGECNPDGTAWGFLGIVSPVAGVAAYMLPYAFIPFTFRLAGGAFATITGMWQDRERGLYDKVRQSDSNRADRMKTRRGNNRLEKAVSPLYQRSRYATKGGLTGLFSQGGENKFAGHTQMAYSDVADKMAEANQNRHLGDETAMGLLAKGYGKKEFRERYAAGLRKIDPSMSVEESERLADQTRHEIEASTGAKIGSAPLRVMGAKHRQSNATGFALTDEDGNTLDADASPAEVRAARRRMEDEQWEEVGMMQRDGLMSAAQLVNARKANGKRQDISSASTAKQIAQAMRAGRADPSKGEKAITDDESEVLLKDALQGGSVGGWVGQRHESAKIFAAETGRHLQEAIQSGNPQEEAKIVARALQAKDISSQLPTLTAEPVSKMLLQQQAQGTNAPNVNVHLESQRQSDLVGSYRRDFEKQWGDVSQQVQNIMRGRNLSPQEQATEAHRIAEQLSDQANASRIGGLPQG